ncbi:DsbA family protein [Sorangium sp. So ce1182]|uniref:DsbA family protein n=1 Tax=Sorangium sp. So ce1182 TaxID=3133334 RepID=UPI003F62D471
MRVAAAFAEQPWVGDYCRRVMQLNFAEDKDINTDEVAAQVLDELGLDGRKQVQEAQSEARKARLRAFSEEAIRRKIFGGPTFFVGDEMFWGNDRLEDALAKASAG